jgi:hypothetical protein
MDKDLYGILLLDSRLRGNDNNEKSISYGRHPRESACAGMTITKNQ